MSTEDKVIAACELLKDEIRRASLELEGLKREIKALEG